MRHRRLRVLLLVLMAGMTCSGARGQTSLPPDYLSAGSLDTVRGDREVIGGAYPGLLVTVIGRNQHGVADEQDFQIYHVATVVYVAQRATIGGAITGYAERFAVCAPHEQDIPAAKRTARLLLLLWSEMHARMRYDHPLDMQRVVAWLTLKVKAGLAAGTGGAQKDRWIYIYDVGADRSAEEWTREVAHEYGHFALVPGVMGFTAPEEDSNGYLGQRLFLKWIRADLKAGVLQAADLPFVTPAQLDDYAARQVTPLIERIAREGVNTRLLAGRAAAAMDYYTGLALYIDSVYGTRQYMDVKAVTRPATDAGIVRALDLYRGVIRSLNESDTIRIAPPEGANGPMERFVIYLPAGRFVVSQVTGLRDWSVEVSAAVASRSGPVVTVHKASWVRVRLSLSGPPAESAGITLRRRMVGAR